MAKKKVPYCPFKVGDIVRLTEKCEEWAGKSIWPSVGTVGEVVHVDSPVRDDCPCRVVWDDEGWRERNPRNLSEGTYAETACMALHNPALTSPTFEQLTGFEEVV